MHKVVTLRERPDLETAVDRLHREAWPVFLRHDAEQARHWPALVPTFPEYQLVLLDDADAVLAAGNTIPFAWDRTPAGLPASIGEILERGLRGRAEGRPTTALAALAAIVGHEHRGEGLSRALIEAMRTVAARHGLSALVAPVRPTFKSHYPLTPMEHYVGWTGPDGSLFDPWLRVHREAGAELLQIAPRAMVVEGTVAAWEEWTGMAFPESGAYVVPGALQPITIDRERDRGRYEDPNVWMHHPVAG